MRAERLTRYARLPRAYRDLPLLHSTVDAFGRAHWLLRVRESTEQASGPYDAMVVTVADDAFHETRLSSVPPRLPRIDSLPDGGFVLADSRCREADDQVQVFDALGRPTWTFQVGDAIEHLLTDESGDLWVGYFDEGIFGDDPLSAAGVRRWSSTGQPLWAYSPPPGADWISECYALNVDGRTAWVYPYTQFALLEVCGDDPPRMRTTSVQGARGVAVHGERVAFLGGYRKDGDRLIMASLTDTSVETVSTTRLARPDGSPLDDRRHVVSRGPRLYVRERRRTDWAVWDISEHDGGT